MQLKGLSSTLELSGVLEEARDIAIQTDQQLNSGHLLLALFTVENRAQGFLQDLGNFELDDLIDAVKTIEREDPEPFDAVTIIHKRTATLAETDHVGTLHLLAGMCRVRASDAYRALELLGVDPKELRNQVIRDLRPGVKRHYVHRSAAPPADRVEGRRDLGGVEPMPVPRVALAEPEPDEEPAAVAQPHVQPYAQPERRHYEEVPARSRYALDPETFPVLTELGRNLTDLAADGRLDPLIGRTREVEQLVDILNKRRANNPCLVGDPGVGKTAVVEGLAQLVVAKDSKVGALGSKIIVELQMGGLVAGTQLRGAFAERLRQIKQEVAQMDGRLVLFIDELHTLVGAGSGDGALDAANDLKTALARGEFPCIGATTEKEYRRYIEADPALERRFEVVLIDEPSQADALEVLKGLARHYSRHHKVTYREEALESCVRLSNRWITERFLPAKAIDVLDLAGAYASRHRSEAVSADDVARVVAQKVGVPPERLLVNDSERLLSMEAHLQSRIIAHDEAMSKVARVIRANFAGFTSTRPMGSFLLLGPTGVGKTECAKVLAEFLFGSREAVTRIDMSEYMDSHSVSRLIGAPPGYVGHEDGGQLTEAVRRRPYQLICFDEVEKASGDVLNVLLQLLEEGQLTDGRGRKVRFRHTAIIMTSNLGHEHFDASRSRMGFGRSEPVQKTGTAATLETARKSFSPELWNRIEEKLVFTPLKIEDVQRVAALLLADSSARIYEERKIAYEVTDDVVPFLIERGGYDQPYGARPMRRTIKELVESLIADAILRGEIEPDSTVTIGVVDGELSVI